MKRPITYKTPLEILNSSRSKRGYLIDFCTVSKVHWNVAGTNCVQASSNYALIEEKVTGQLIQLWLDEGEFEIKFDTWETAIEI